MYLNSVISSALSENTFVTRTSKMNLCFIWIYFWIVQIHYDDVIMGAMTSLITSLTIIYSTVYSDADQRKHQSSAPLAFVWGIHRGPVNSPHKWPVTRKMFPFDDVIMWYSVFSKSTTSWGLDKITEVCRLHVSMNFLKSEIWPSFQMSL